MGQKHLDPHPFVTCTLICSCLFFVTKVCQFLAPQPQVIPSLTLVEDMWAPRLLLSRKHGTENPKIAYITHAHAASSPWCGCHHAFHSKFFRVQQNAGRICDFNVFTWYPKLDVRPHHPKSIRVNYHHPAALSCQHEGAESIGKCLKSPSLKGGSTQSTQVVRGQL